MLTLQLNQNIENKFNIIAETYKMNHNEMFKDVINYYVKELQKGMKNIERNLSAFEKKYNQKSNEFYVKYMNGELDDLNDDFLQWSGEYEIWLEHKNDLKMLTA